MWSLFDICMHENRITFFAISRSRGRSNAFVWTLTNFDSAGVDVGDSDFNKVIICLRELFPLRV